MRVPLSWLREYVALPAEETGRQLAERLVRVGLEVETVETVGADLRGPLVAARVLDIDEFTASNGRTIRYCRLDDGPPASAEGTSAEGTSAEGTSAEGASGGGTSGGGARRRGVICGATNFAVGDRVALALPGAVLPGGFAISERQTYGRRSEGMICSARELGTGDDHDGILVLPPETPVGADVIALLGLRDEVLDIAVTPDRGYCLSLRGVGREAVVVDGGESPAEFRDPAGVPGSVDPLPWAEEEHPVLIDDETACDRIVIRVVTGLNPAAVTPLWMRRRLQLSGMRPVSLAVDVTNYVMLELGQPLHAFDRAKLDGPIVVRRARAAERLTTLDHTERKLDPDDILITDSSGPIGLAGTLGGLRTEVDASSTELVIEAAHFDAIGVARMARRHKLSSEASRRFERGVDPALPARASARAVRLLAELGGATIGGVTEVDRRGEPTTVTMPVDHPGRVAGVDYPAEVVVRRLEQVGCRVLANAPAETWERSGPATLTVEPPSWRPDLTDPNDLAEEVIRLEGYENLPARLPTAPSGRGYTAEQRLRRRVGTVLAASGFVEVHCYPFVGAAAADALGLPAEDARRRTVRLLNPLSEEESGLRTTLLPGLFTALRRNIGRGTLDVALFEIGTVFHPRAERSPESPRLTREPGEGLQPGTERIAPLGVSARPGQADLAALDAALPEQPRSVAVVLAGQRDRSGWWGRGRPVDWSDAVEAARAVAWAAGLRPDLRAVAWMPWHPGRCAAVVVGGEVVGHAGELHPRVVAAFELPERTCAVELNLSRLGALAGGLVPAPVVSPYPVTAQDVALVVDAGVPAAEVEAALRDGAGPLLESIRLFDVYTGEQVGPDRRSLAYALRFRAPDRTLTVAQATEARRAAVAEATRRTGAVLRGA